MKHHWLHQNDNTKLIIFFCGWGNDYNPFLSLQHNEFDVVLFYDYSDYNSEIDFPSLVSQYTESHLIAWSLGVFVANTLLQNITFSSATAINGTIAAIDDKFGIPLEIFDGTLSNLDERNRDKFFKRMCSNKEALTYFNNNKPQRELQNQIFELKALKDTILNTNSNKNIFNKAIVSMQDAIFPPQNMLDFWQTKLEHHAVVKLEAPHFLFYQFLNFNELLKIN